jgi:hypothetical protein
VVVTLPSVDREFLAGKLNRTFQGGKGLIDLVPPLIVLVEMQQFKSTAVFVLVDHISASVIAIANLLAIFVEAFELQLVVRITS